MIEKLAIVALLLWFLQWALAYRQARLFQKHVSSLRKLGRCATGMSGSRYRGRVYAVLVANPATHTIVKAEQLSGYTVFARPKPVQALEGRSLDELLAPEAAAIEGVSQRLQEAARSAAQAIQTSLDKMAASA